ncbi:MAG: cytochrome c family protein [Thalassobaculum sp.]|uniref:cytochrome c family protein n=1 Tax=Thalassobaculum sp. TaxID=2022740 RepID=UPI0032ED83B8
MNRQLENSTAAAIAALVLAVCLFTGPGTALAQGDGDRFKVIGPTKCAECHKAETEVWKGTTHHALFTDLTRSKEANQIAERMGMRRIKSESLCLDCHFTTVATEGGGREAIAGVSCESCHGPASVWQPIHSGFSGKKEGQETPAEIATRWEKSEAAGMIRPKDMYRWAKNCFSCHVVPQEKLVNTGGHRAGSPFELVAWSQGEVRHNLWYNKGAINEPASRETKRLMFVVGRAVELETSLRAVGKATERAGYAVAMAKRAQAARQAVDALYGYLKIDELKQISTAANSAGLKLNNEAALSAAADEVGAVTRKIVEKYDGSTFGAIDGVLPPESAYKGKPAR